MGEGELRDSGSRLTAQLFAIPSTAERVRRTFFAALNYAHRTNPDKVPSDLAWRSVYSFRNIDRPRTRFLSVSEAKRLLNTMPQDFRQLARGALYTGLRLGELLALTVSDFGDGQIHVRHSTLSCLCYVTDHYIVTWLCV